MGVGGGEALRNREGKRTGESSYGDERGQDRAGRMWAEWREMEDQKKKSERKKML